MLLFSSINICFLFLTSIHVHRREGVRFREGIFILWIFRECLREIVEFISGFCFIIILRGSSGLHRNYGRIDLLRLIWHYDGPAFSCSLYDAAFRAFIGSSSFSIPHALLRCLTSLITILKVRIVVIRLEYVLRCSFLYESTIYIAIVCLSSIACLLLNMQTIPYLL